jgi:hypothetical protein
VLLALALRCSQYLMRQFHLRGAWPLLDRPQNRVVVE